MELSSKLLPNEPKTSRRSLAANVLAVYRVLALVVAIAAAFYFSTGSFISSVGDLRNAVNGLVSSSATLLGFLVSAGALLYAVANTTLARNLQRTGHFRDLLEDLFLAAACFLAALVLGLACLFFDADSATPKVS